MASTRIDIKLSETIKSIAKFRYYKLLYLRDYAINKDQKNVIINVDEEQSRILKYYGSNIKYYLDIFNTGVEHRKRFKDKVLVIPAGIHYLSVTGVLDCHIDFSKAIDLKYLEYNYHINNKGNDAYKTMLWPPNLKYLLLYYYPYPLFNLPDGLQYLQLPLSISSGAIDNLPASLIGLDFTYTTFNSKHSAELELIYLPHGLRYLKLHGGIKCELQNLPPTLEVLNLDADEYSQSLNCLPDNIRYLTLGNSRVPITKLSNELKELTIYYDVVTKGGIYSRNTYDILADMNFPEGLEKLIIIDELGLLDSEIQGAINDLIMNKMKNSNSTNRTQIQIKYC